MTQEEKVLLIDFFFIPNVLEVGLQFAKSWKKTKTIKTCFISLKMCNFLKFFSFVFLIFFLSSRFLCMFKCFCFTCRFFVLAEKLLFWKRAFECWFLLSCLQKIVAFCLVVCKFSIILLIVCFILWNKTVHFWFHCCKFWNHYCRYWHTGFFYTSSLFNMNLNLYSRSYNPTTFFLFWHWKVKLHPGIFSRFHVIRNR